MATTAAITLSPSSLTVTPPGVATGAAPPPTGTASGPVTITCTVTTAAGAPAVNVLGIQPIVPNGTPVSMGSPPTGFGQNVTVPGNGGSLAFSWQMWPWTPTNAPLGSAGSALAIGANVSLSDGTTAVATTANVTIIGSPVLAQLDANGNT